MRKNVLLNSMLNEGTKSLSFPAAHKTLPLQFAPESSSQTIPNTIIWTCFETSTLVKIKRHKKHEKPCLWNAGADSRKKEKKNRPTALRKTTSSLDVSVRAMAKFGNHVWYGPGQAISPHSSPARALSFSYLASQTNQMKSSTVWASWHYCLLALGPTLSMHLQNWTVINVLLHGWKYNFNLEICNKF